MADWYYAKNGKQNGPITSTQLRQLAQSGELTPDDLVFREGGTNWIAASTVAGLFPSGGGAAVKAAQPRGDSGFAVEDGGRDREDDRPERDEPRRKDRKSSYWVDLLMFRRMIAPTIIIVLFWLGVAAVLLSAVLGMAGGVMAMFATGGSVAGGLGMIVGSLLSIPFGILVIRLYCELLILLFRMNETLADIKETLERQNKN